MRRRHQALILASLLLFACGDSDGDSPEDQAAGDAAADARAHDAHAAHDAGLPPRDAPLDAQIALDAQGAEATVAEAGSGDAAATLRAAALDPRGVRADMERVNLVIEANCEQQIACGFETDKQRCELDTSANWLVFLLGDVVCVDAVLDQIGCYATVGCDAVEECAEGIGAAMSACSNVLQGDAGR